MTLQQKIGLKIKNLRETCGLSQTELALKVGYKDKTSIAKIEKGLVDLPQSKLSAFSAAFKVNTSYWFDDETFEFEQHEDNSSTNKSTGIRIPVLGRVAAGIPIEAIEDIIDTEEITEELASSGTFFGLKIKGNSMEPRMCENDVVIVRQQSDAEDGDIVIATVNGDEATCKRLKKYNDGIVLISNNPNYDPMYFSNKEIQEKPVKIIGKVVELRGKF
uniref:Repressor protein CI n=1 Tax=Myoviridae sp. ctNQr16 TaxID=2826644 RepID=A0A8S5MAQ4_9CAUD|nr:MAG TPA: Repressor protein CI [Myoviridae sp. ctNQr16]